MARTQLSGLIVAATLVLGEIGQNIAFGSFRKDGEVIVNMADYSSFTREDLALSLAKAWRGMGEGASLDGQRVQGVKGMSKSQNGGCYSYQACKQVLNARTPEEGAESETHPQNSKRSKLCRRACQVILFCLSI
jgi:hypothetical protein